MSLIERFINHFELKREIEDFETIHNEIVKGISFRGTNLWILGFAIIVASVGLNTNSTAVIIGAMLISPLMGPINGMGYSIATYDFLLFKRAIKNFGFAVLTSLGASTLYFVLSPVSTAHSELLARTSPTIYDVLIAFFGGLAGIVAISSKLKGNVIPGVAIATALMPPLCTVGYGIGTGQWSFALGAMYLFTINTVFIALASLLVCQYLDFPIRAILEPKQKQKVNSVITLVTLLTLIPSIYFGYTLVINQKYAELSNRFISSASIYKSNYLIRSDFDIQNKKLQLVYAGDLLTDDDKLEIQKKAKDMGLEDLKVDIKQGISTDKQNQIKSETDILRNELFILRSELTKKSLTIDSLYNVSRFGQTLLNEIKEFYPQMVACTFSSTYLYEQDTVSGKPIDVVIFKTNDIEKSQKNYDNIKNWLVIRIGRPDVMLVLTK